MCKYTNNLMKERSNFSVSIIVKEMESELITLTFYSCFIIFFKKDFDSGSTFQEGI